MTNQDLHTVPEQRKLEKIVCPVCKSEEIAFVSEYHKAIGWRAFLFFVYLVAAIMISIVITDVVGQKDAWTLFFHDSKPIFILFIVFFSISKLNISLQESKTHVQAICKDCGNLWLLN